MPLTFQTLNLLLALGCHTWEITPEKCDKVKLDLLKKVGFSVVFPKNSSGKNFRPPKNSARSYTNLQMQLSGNQIDPTHTLAEEER